MGDKIVTIVTLTVTVIVMSFMTAIISTERKIDEATSIVQEFTERAQYRGCITKSDYENVIARIPYRSFKLQITHIKDVNLNGEIIKDIYFPNNIRGSLNSYGIYKMNIGDQIKVDLMVKDRSMLDTISFMIFKRENSDTKMIASDTGVIVNKKY